MCTSNFISVMWKGTLLSCNGKVINVSTIEDFNCYHIDGMFAMRHSISFIVDCIARRYELISFCFRYNYIIKCFRNG